MSWQTQKLEAVADFCLGKMLDQKKNRGELLPYLANVNVRWGEFCLAELREMRFEQHELDRYGLKYGDIVMCEGGEPGRCAIWKEQCSSMMIQKALHRIRPHDCLRPEFLYYFFLYKGRTGHLASLFTGSTIKHLPREKLALVDVPVPPHSTQDQIASVLAAYDDLIENNRRRIQLLEQAARLLYKEWFVHLRFPGHEHTRIIDGVPEGWAMRPIKDVVEGVYDGPHATPSASDDGPIFLGIKNISESGRLNLTSKRCISENDFSKWTRRVTPQPGDIVFSYEATLNLYALIPEGFRGCLGRRLALVRPIARDRTGLFIYYSFFTHRWRTVIEQNRLCGATVDRVPIAKFPDFPLLMPPQRLVVAFDDHVWSLRKQMETLERENELLANARDILLPKLMTGESTV